MAFFRGKTRCARVRGRLTPLLACALLMLGCEYASEGPVLVRTTPSGVAGSAPVASTCDDPQNVACLDFEDPNEPIPSLVLATPTGTGEYDSASSAVGEQSVKISVDAEANYVIEVASSTPVTAGPLYLRALFQLPAAGDPVSYVVLMEAMAADAMDKISFDWRPQGFGINVAGATQYTAQPLPRAQWFCAELGIEVDASSGTVRLAIDGASAVDLAMLNTFLSSGLSRYRVGINGGLGNPPFQIHVDDFIVRTAPIGCP